MLLTYDSTVSVMLISPLPSSGDSESFCCYECQTSRRRYVTVVSVDDDDDPTFVIVEKFVRKSFLNLHFNGSGPSLMMVLEYSIIVKLMPSAFAFVLDLENRRFVVGTDL